MTDKEKEQLTNLVSFAADTVGDVEEAFDEYPDNDGRDFKFRYVGEKDDICMDICVDFDYTVRASFSKVAENDDDGEDNFASVPDFEIGSDDLGDWFERFKAGER